AKGEEMVVGLANVMQKGSRPAFNGDASGGGGGGGGGAIMVGVPNCLRRERSICDATAFDASEPCEPCHRTGLEIRGQQLARADSISIHPGEEDKVKG
ncbi:hypothetical protein E4U53_000374, partial [Claviceps sorghi]